MYLLYLDASGSPLPQDINTKHFVLLGLCMREGSWFGMDNRLRRLKSQYAFPGDDLSRFELHVKNFAVTFKEQDEIAGFEGMTWIERRQRVRAIRDEKLQAEKDPLKREERRKRYKDTDPYVHLTRRERSSLLEESVDVIAGYDKLKLFAEAISKTHPLVVENQVETVPQAFLQVVSRFDTFLRKKATWRHQGGNRSVDYGLLILDNDPSTESTIERLFKEYRERGHPFGDLAHVIDAPFFASSQKVSGLQLADVAAYVLRRYLDTGAKAGSHEERQFVKIYQRFDRDSYGKLHGLRHYVESQSCNCTICQERGHAPTPPAES